MNYQESLDYISSTYTMGIKLGLENITELLKRLGNPQEKMKIIHVAGTNGKGSTCSFLSSILAHEGYQVGLYTSPYLEVFNERIRINGKNISDEELAECTTLVREKIEEMVAEGHPHPSEFEVTTAIGFVCFARAELEFLVLEVGMGGRFDATNVVQSPLVTIITSISKDHVQYLGDTLKSIAFEKAGIIKEAIPLILYPQETEARQEILKVAKEKHAPVVIVNPEDITIESHCLEGQEISLYVSRHRYQHLQISLLGEHQAKNALTAIMALKVLEEKGQIHLSEEGLRGGLVQARWTGRLERIKKEPLSIIDGAHNEGGAMVLAKAIKDYLPDYEIVLVLGMLRDKEVGKVADILLPLVEQVITTTPSSDRAMDSRELAQQLKKYGKPVQSAGSAKEAIFLAEETAKEGKKAILYAGSLYMIGEIRTLLTTKK